MGDKRITKEDFTNLKEMPKKVIQFKVENPFNNLEMALIHKGHKATEMEDKWNFYMEGNKIYLHRSWTGICCYILELYDNDENIFVTANNNPNEQKFNNNDGSDDFYQRIIDEIYRVIIGRLDLGKYMFNPQKTESEEKQPNYIIDEMYRDLMSKLDLEKIKFNSQKTESKENQPNDCIFERDDDFEQAVKEGRAVKYEAPDDTDSIN